MEDYDKFVQHRLSQLRESGEKQHNKPSTASSLIRFYGRPILPPLLSGEQREEMQRHRHAPQKAAGHRMLKDDIRMAYVQTILQSVQLTKAQTLEELLQESEIITKSSYSHNTSNGTKDSVSVLPPSLGNVQASVSSPPMTSTTYSAFFTSNVTPHQSNELLTNSTVNTANNHGSIIGVSHQSVSSGYTTYENAENAISVSGRFDLGSGNHDFGSSERANNMKGFLLHNTSNTIAKMPAIISYPPIDGEELERSGLESSFSNNSIGVKDNCCTSFQENSVLCDHLPEEQSESNCMDGPEGGEISSFGTVLDLDRDHGSDKLRASNVAENSPETSPPLPSHSCQKTEIHMQPELKDTKPSDTHIDEAEPSEEPYRLSLQALLKKSQEYRRRQRMLRNQAKSTKIQERTQEHEKARAEEQSHSDKENDEFPKKGTVTAEETETKDRRGSIIPTVEMSTKKSWENERIIESGYVGKNINLKSESTYSTGHEKPKEMPSVGEEAVFRNNKLNSSQEVITEHKENRTPLPQPMSTNTLVQETFYSTSSPTALYKGVRKYTIPIPNLCGSPVHYKSRSSSKEAADGTERVVGKSGFNEDHNETERSLEHQSMHTALASPVSVMVEGNVTLGMNLTMRSQHIDQLESNLSDLKVLISELEATVKENMENLSQTESNSQSECSFKSIEHSEQINNDHLLQQSSGEGGEEMEKLTDDGDSSYVEYRPLPRRESFINSHNTHKDTGPRLCGPDDFPLKLQGKEPERVNISELRLVKAITLERHKEKQTGKDGQTYSCTNQRPAAKCILSTAQRMRIPNPFRNVPPESTSSHNVSVLSDTSNHLVDRRNDTTGKGHDSTHTSSLNQSYDVDTPSDLWLLDQSGSELGSKSKHLTPESGEGQDNVSKVKRRLLMYGTEDTKETSPATSRGASSVVLPSIPKAPVHVYGACGSQKDKQEQLKQIHAAQIRALQDEHRRQQEELLQELAARYSLLQGMSFPCSMSASRLGDTLTFSTLSQPSSPVSDRYHPLLSAAIKGFLTRRLLRTERVQQLVRTIRDTHHFLQAIQQQSPTSKQDLLLQERVTLQLRAARYEVYDIFFSSSARERMQLINRDRELARDRQLRRKNGHTSQPKGRSSLSTATQKSLERKKGIMMQKKAAEKHRGVVTRTGHKTGFSAEQPLKTKRGQFRANPQRVSKSTYSTRPR